MSLTFPYTFTNGTIADATQVMANFNVVLGGVNNSIFRDGSSLVSADIPFSGYKLTGVGTPALGTDAANKAYVDAKAALAALGYIQVLNYATGNGSTDDTGGLNNAIAAAAVVSGSTLFFGPGTYLTTGNTVLQANFTRFQTAGRAILKDYGGANTLLTINGPYGTGGTNPTGEGTPAWIYGLEFSGANADLPYGFTAGTAGLHLGSTTASVLNVSMNDTFAHNLAFGYYDYGGQQIFWDNCRAFRNQCGHYIRNDSVNGGGTAGKINRADYQLNAVGLLINNYYRTAYGLTCTLANASTSVTNITTANLTNGMYISGPGIKPGTTITITSGSTLTLSQVTTSTAAMAGVPVLVKNVDSFGLGQTVNGAVFQGNSTCALAAYGIDYLELNDIYCEANEGGSPVTIENRTVPVYPLYFNACHVYIETQSSIGEGGANSAVRAEAGTTVVWRDTQCPTTAQSPFSGDLTSSIQFQGKLQNASGYWNLRVSQWPDSVTCSGSFFAFGVSNREYTDSYKNYYVTACPRTPLPQNVTGCTVSYLVDAVKGPCTAVQFLAVAGGFVTNNWHSFEISNAGNVKNGDTVLLMIDVRADSYTSMSLSGNYWAGSTYAAIQVTPEWQTWVGCFVMNTDVAGPLQAFFPTGSDGPKIYYTNMHVFIQPASWLQNTSNDLIDISPISAIIRDGLVNVGNMDGALWASSAYTPAALAAGASRATKTVTVNAAQVGDRVTVTYSDATNPLYQWGGVVTAANTVTITEYNPTAGSITPPAGTIKVNVIPQ